MRDQSLCSPGWGNESDLAGESGSESRAAWVRLGGEAGAEVSFFVAVTISVSSQEASDSGPGATVGQQGRRLEEREGTLGTPGGKARMDWNLRAPLPLSLMASNLQGSSEYQLHFCLTQTQNHTGKGILKKHSLQHQFIMEPSSTSLRLTPFVLLQCPWRETSWLLICLP